MVEEDVEYLESRVGVEHRSGKGSSLAFDETTYKDICRQRGEAMLYRQDERDGVCYPGSGKNGCKPEKRASEEVERVGGHEVRAQVGKPVPAELTAAYSVVGEIVEGNLLRVEIAVVDEVPAVAYHDRNNRQKQGDNA